MKLDYVPRRTTDTSGFFQLAALVKPLGFVIGPSPVNAIPSPPATPRAKPAVKPEKAEPEPKKKKKKA